MPEAVLVFNAGSSSIKFSAFLISSSGLQLALRGQIEGLFTSPRFVAKNADGEVVSEKEWGDGFKLGHDGAIEHLRGFLRERARNITLLGVGNRVGHGGPKYSQPVRVTEEVLADLERFIPLAPLHQPHNVGPIRLMLKRMPDVPQVACFDTAFHRSNPPLAQMYGLPKALTDAGAYRYGFHGLSYEYIASVLQTRAPQAAAGRTIVLHLGNGSSMCAMSGGRSVTSTMGFSALDGLPMGTRCGSIDPGLILFLLQHKKMDVAALEKLLYSQSGLLGVSGISSDVRTLLASKDPNAQLAIDFYVYRIGRELGSLAAALRGLDAIVFTAGIGEHAAGIRERVCRDASWLGIDLNPEANARGGPCITTSRSQVAAWVFGTDEEAMIARHTCDVLGIMRAEEKPVPVGL